MTAEEIAKLAEEHRHVSPSMGNYQTLMNDAWVMLRELAKRVAELEHKNGGDTGQSK